MVKEPVSTLDARWVQAQLGVKLLTRTKTVGSPISSQSYVAHQCYLRRGSARGHATADARYYRAESVIDATNCQIQLLCRTLRQSSFVVWVLPRLPELEDEHTHREGDGKRKTSTTSPMGSRHEPKA
ncbi:hypothetical protein TgHK011_006211 [Trichoderma gracile]|nr:hypothetical protein TgHK011_006211 [Trichoderma gracile]